MKANQAVFSRLLETGHQKLSEYREEKISRLEFLSDYIFDFVTYDGEMAEMLALKAIHVCEAINRRQTFDFIKDPDRYLWFLVMVNTPFFVDRITWGGSIRSAMWQEDIGYESPGLFDGDKQMDKKMFYTIEAWTAFIEAVIEFGLKEVSLEPAGESK